ncbi:MAG: ABC transporter permease [Candidatus Omnitrophota bacterium]
MASFNLWRRKSRTILVIIMLGFGLAAMIFSQGLYEGMMVQMKGDLIRTGAGEIVVYRKGYEASRLLSDYIRDPGTLKEMLSKDDNIAYFVSRVRCDGIVSSAKYSQEANIIGIDVDKEGPFIGYKGPVVKGEFKADGNANTVMLGKKLAEKLKVDIGKKIVVQGQALDKELTAFAFRVAGIIRTNNPDIDTSGVLVDKRQLQKLFKVDGVTEFSMLLKGKTDVDTIKNELREKIKKIDKEPLEVFTWKETQPLMVLWDTVFEYFIYISYFIMFIVVALGIFFILFISIMERVKEFGILMALGTPFLSICRIVFFESLIMGLIGYVCGALSGLFLLIIFKNFGLDLSHFSSGLIDVGMAAVMFPEIRGGYFVLAFIAMLTSSGIAAIVPLWKLRRLKAVEAIRFI